MIHFMILNLYNLLGSFIPVNTILDMAYTRSGTNSQYSSYTYLSVMYCIAPSVYHFMQAFILVFPGILVKFGACYRYH